MGNGKRLLAAVATATAIAAASAAPATATQLTPAGTEVTATLKEGTILRIMPLNGYLEYYFGCITSETTIVVPEENERLDNTNRGPESSYEEEGPVGTYSEGPGSVVAEFAPPTFEECDIYLGNEEEPGEDGEPVLLGAVEAVGAWSMAGFAPNLPEEEEDEIGAALITLPKEGMLLYGGTCEATVAPEAPAVITAEYDNESHELTIDGQLEADFTGIFCLGMDTPVQFEAEYTVSDEFQIVR